MKQMRQNLLPGECELPINPLLNAPAINSVHVFWDLQKKRVLHSSAGYNCQGEG